MDPEGGMRDVRALDNVSFTDWFKSHGGSQASIDRMWDPIGERRLQQRRRPPCECPCHARSAPAPLAPISRQLAALQRYALQELRASAGVLA